MAEARKTGRSSAAKKSSGSAAKARPAAKSRTAASSRAKPKARAAKAGTAKPAAAKRTGGASKAGAARKRTAKAKSSGSSTPAERDFSGKSAAELRDALTKSLIRPLEIVMLSRDRIQEAFDEAVKRGRMTQADAQDLVRGLVELGRKQTNDVLGDLEQLLGRGQTEAIEAAEKARKGVGEAGERVRRAVGQGFPIEGYDDLSASEVQKRLPRLTLAELRKVRDYERRNANRKSVLQAIERKLG